MYKCWFINSLALEASISQREVKNMTTANATSLAPPEIFHEERINSTSKTHTLGINELQEERGKLARQESSKERYWRGSIQEHGCRSNQPCLRTEARQYLLIQATNQNKPFFLSFVLANHFPCKRGHRSKDIPLAIYQLKANNDADTRQMDRFLIYV